ncbi:unnamed protein product [Absidia cylindrospora]
MKIIFLSILCFFLFGVHGDVDYFKEPAMENQEFTPGTSAQFVVSQLPDIDGQVIYANVYAEGNKQDLVQTIQSWSPSSVSDSAKNDFTFTWHIPLELIPGRYFAKIDINNDQDDNDICRSKTFVIVPGGGGASTSRFTQPAAYNPGMKTPMTYNSAAAAAAAGQRYASNTKLSALHLRRRRRAKSE